MKKTVKRKCSVLLTLTLLMNCGTLLGVRAETSEEAFEQQEAVEEAVSYDEAVHIAYSYDGETEKAEIGTTEGQYSIAEVDAEHGKSLSINTMSGSPIIHFYGEDVKENPLMEVISFEIYCNEANLRGFSEFIASKDSTKEYYERFKRLFFLMETGQTTYFQDYKSSGYIVKWDRKAKQWYKLDVCADYINREMIFYMDNKQLGKIPLEEGMNGFMGFRYVFENKNIGTKYFDNIKYVQILKRGEKLNLDGICYPEYIEKSIAAEINTNALGSILFDKNIAIDVELTNTVNTAKTVELETAVKAENGIMGETKKYTVSLAAGEKKTVSVSPVVDSYGFNTLIVNIKDANGDESYTLTKDFSVANGPKNGETNSKIALNDHTASHAKEGEHGGDYSLEKFELMKKAGASGLRFMINWNVFEKNGAFALPGNFQKVFDDMRTVGLEHYNLIFGGNSSLGIKGPPRTPEEIKKFANYAAESAKASGDITHKYLIWNEYNHVPFNSSGGTVDDYIEILKAVGPAIKAVDPDAKIYGFGAITSIANVYDWAEEFLQKGGQNYCDGFTFHPYAPGSPPAESIKRFEQFWDLFEKYDVTDKDMVISEVGWTTNAVSELHQASYQIELAASIYDRVETIVWYVDQEKQGNNPSEDKFGMIRSWDAAYSAPYEPFSAKPAFLAMANFNRLMNGATGTENKNIGETIELKGFKDRDGKSMSILWNNNESDKNIALKVDAESVTVCDMYGNEKEMAAANGVINVTVGPTPIYIIGSYSNIEEAEPTCEFSTSLIELTTDDRVSLYIKKNFDDEATIEVKTPQNVTVSKNDGFGADNRAEIQLDTGSKRSDNEQIEIIIKDKNSGRVYCDNKISLEYKDTISGSVLAKYFRSRRWQGSIKIKSNKHTENTSGTIKITKPDYLAATLGEFKFSDIAPLQTKEITFNIPETLADVKTVVEADVVLDNGETFKIADDVYFTGFARSKNPPVIDGNVGDDEWDKDVSFRLQYESQVKSIPDWTGPLDVGGKVYGQWDNDNLYIAAEIDDDVHFTTDETKRIWYVDSIQIAVTAKKEKTAIRTEYGFGELNGELAMERYSFMGVDTDITGWTDKQNFKDKVKLAVKRDEDKKKTYYEISIPWEELYGEKIKPASRDSLYFSMLVNDNDGESRGWIEFCPGIGASKDASQFITVPILKNR